MKNTPNKSLTVIRKCLDRVLPGLYLDSVDRETTLQEIGVDSLSMIELLRLLEHELGTTIPISSVVGIETVSELVSLVDNLFEGTGR